MTQSYALDPAARLTIRNAGGRIFVYGSEVPRLEISATRRAFSRERLEAIRVAVTIEGASASIETIYPPASEGLFADRSGTVDYIILVPESCRLARVELGRGEMVIEGMRGGGVDAQLGVGLMHVNDCFAPTRLHLGQGGLNLFYGWWEEEPIAVAATIGRGRARVFLPPDASLTLTATNRSGNIVNRLTPAKSVRQAGGNILRLELGAGGASEIQLRGEAANLRIERAY